MVATTEYGSVTRPLATDESSPPSTPTLESGRPQWNRRYSAASMISSPQPRNTREEIFYRARKTLGWANALWMRMSLWQQILAIVVLATVGVLFILFWVYNESILEWLHPKAVAWSERSGGWLLIWFLIFATAFPPLIGYSTMLTIAGFIYGVPNGWFIAATANVAGATCAFLASRYVFRDWVEKHLGGDTRFEALSLVLKHDGIKLLTMVRLCPLPYSASNGALSTFPTISPLAFATATAFATPKLFIHIYIGSRFGAIGREGRQMDGAGKAINYVSIAAGMIIGIATGLIIYRRTKARAKELAYEEQAKLEDREAALAHPDAFADDDAEEFEEDAVPSNANMGDVIDFLDHSSDTALYKDDASTDGRSNNRKDDN